MSWGEAYRRASAAVLYQIGWAIVSVIIIGVGFVIIGSSDEATNGQWALGGFLIVVGYVLFMLSFIAVGLKVLTDSITDHVRR
jgi:uncharacterized RDD family membrane protein YckC